MSAVSILISGDCGGKLTAMFKRVASVNKSNGPFAALLCVGSFFQPSDPAGDTSDDGCELLEFIAQNKQAPVPTYFIGSFGKSSDKAIKALSEADCGVHYLGRSGVTEVAGLTVAFLDGLFHPTEYAADTLDDDASSCRYFREMDIAKLKLAADGAGDIDVFLTCQWPAGLLAGVPPPLRPKGMEGGGNLKNSATLLNDTAALIRPRYHVASGEGIYYARPPYQNPDRGVGGHVTRFIGLAPVGNAAKEKSLHALKLTPMARMDLGDVMAKPPDTTLCPYTTEKKFVGGPKRPAEVRAPRPTARCCWVMGSIGTAGDTPLRVNHGKGGVAT
eukprot:jgi/Tetstr1/462520/TSEL_007509.t1